MEDMEDNYVCIVYVAIIAVATIVVRTIYIPKYTQNPSYVHHMLSVIGAGLLHM